MQVVDGTSCDLNDGVRRVCVEASCRPVGCDGMLGSPAREDKCRVCGGDGTNCITAQGDLEEKVHTTPRDKSPETKPGPLQREMLMSLGLIPLRLRSFDASYPWAEKELVVVGGKD